jgi:hypothetical protein
MVVETNLESSVLQLKSSVITYGNGNHCFGCAQALGVAEIECVWYIHLQIGFVPRRATTRCPTSRGLKKGIVMRTRRSPKDGARSSRSCLRDRCAPPLDAHCGHLPSPTGFSTTFSPLPYATMISMTRPSIIYIQKNTAVCSRNNVANSSAHSQDVAEISQEK